MATQQELDKCYMQVAEAHASLSKAKRKHVGCCIVTTNGVMLGGCNGMAPNGDNDCEDIVDGEFVTKAETIHGELNCLLKAARQGVSVVGGTLYTTLSCCKPCSEMVAAAGIYRVVYSEGYRDMSGIDNLKRLGVDVEYFEN
jgi:dCMP deaminase